MSYKKIITNIFGHKDTVDRNALRAVITIAVSMIVGKLLHALQGYWVPMMALVLLQMSTGASIKRAKERIIGTVLGVLFGVMFAVLMQNQFYLLFASVPIFIFIAVYLIPISYSGAIFVVTTLLIVLLAHNSGSPWVFAFNRTIDTIIAAIIVVLVSALFFPSWAKEHFQRSLLQGLEKCQNCLDKIIDLLLAGKHASEEEMNLLINIEDHLAETRQHIDEFSHEPNSMVIADGSAYSVIIAQERMQSLLASMLLVVNSPDSLAIKKDLRESLNKFCVTTKKLVSELIAATKSNEGLPDFADLNSVLQELKEHENSAEFSLFYRSICAYISELMHIEQAIKQLRFNVFCYYEHRP